MNTIAIFLGYVGTEKLLFGKYEKGSEGANSIQKHTQIAVLATQALNVQTREDNHTVLEELALRAPSFY